MERRRGLLKKEDEEVGLWRWSCDFGQEGLRERERGEDAPREEP